ncbi:hypothetical protein [Cupriavidus sp. TMH.W2]|uniref:hypothetical protein n=1 Tax=Cupriavidus sp. TMH.W2 TaxID=3434465 RepID=UPI003D77BCCF
MPSFTSVELDEQRIDMAAALAQGRVYVKQAPDDQRYPYVVLTERYAQDFASVYVGDAWMASVDGEKAEYTMPSPLPVRKDALCALDNAPALKMALLQQVSRRPA